MHTLFIDTLDKHVHDPTAQPYVTLYLDRTSEVAHPSYEEHDPTGWPSRYNPTRSQPSVTLYLFSEMFGPKANSIHWSTDAAHHQLSFSKLQILKCVHLMASLSPLLFHGSLEIPRDLINKVHNVMMMAELALIHKCSPTLQVDTQSLSSSNDSESSGEKEIRGRKGGEGKSSLITITPTCLHEGTKERHTCCNERMKKSFTWQHLNPFLRPS